MKYFEISEEIAQGLLNYLVTRPYVEVHQGVSSLMNLKLIREDTDGSKTDPSEPAPSGPNNSGNGIAADGAAQTKERIPA